MESIQVLSDPLALVRAAIDQFVHRAQGAIQARGRFSVALAGGSTPEPVYAGLAQPEIQTELAWKDIHFFFGDERYVLPDHPDSNFRMVHEALFSKVAVPEINVHRVRTELNAGLAAFDYETRLKAFFLSPWPRFDLVLLGMGSDGHTASLFPYSSALNETCRWFVAHQLPSQSFWRLTLTKNAINAARQIVVLVSGESKAHMLAEVFSGAYAPEQKPIQLISPQDGDLLWLLDESAASQLSDKWIRRTSPRN
jgi:6-phosphogluconolactonase